jgi:hypothetical protein
MGKRINPELKKVQRSVAFCFYQMRFFADYPEFKPDALCRDEVDKQIAMVAPEYLPMEIQEKLMEKEIETPINA